MPVNKPDAVISVCQHFTIPASHVRVLTALMALLTRYATIDRHVVSALLHFASDFVMRESN